MGPGGKTSPPGSHLRHEVVDGEGMDPSSQDQRCVRLHVCLAALAGSLSATLVCVQVIFKPASPLVDSGHVTQSTVCAARLLGILGVSRQAIPGVCCVPNGIVHSDTISFVASSPQ